MRKWLAFLVLILIGLGAVAVWLAGKATSDKPEPGPVRVEIEDAF